METERKIRFGVCCLCQREVFLTFHHLIPKSQHRKKWAQKKLSRADKQKGINICRKCHNGVHNLFSEKDLAKRLNTLADLAAEPQLQKHISWVSKQKN